MSPAVETIALAAETSGDRGAIGLAHRTLKPILRALEQARRRGTLGTVGARLLDIAREARRELARLGRKGGAGAG